MLRLHIVIPTYKRSHHVINLLDDLALQTYPIATIIIVDSDDESDELVKLLGAGHYPYEVVYIPSNHKNLAFQRYLGTVIADEPDVLISLDDDLRIPDAEMLEKLLAPFEWDETTVGVTSDIYYAHRPIKSIRENIETYLADGVLHRMGTMSPVGYRIFPVQVGEYLKVRWMSGGVLGFKYIHIKECPHYPDIFAINEDKNTFGLGIDDNFLSYWASQFGNIYLVLNAVAEHPHTATNSQSHKNVYGFAYADAYVRRYHNDHYRLSHKPKITDRIALLWHYISYLGYLIRQIIRRPYRLRHYIAAIGYTHGILVAIFRPPSAERLRPDVEWYVDAKRCYDEAITFSAKDKV